MNLKLFTRTEAKTTKQTTSIFLEEIKESRREVLTFSTLIPLGHFLYIVLQPLIISFIIQSLITNPHDFNTPFILLGAMTVTSLLTILVNHFGFITLFKHEEKVTTRLAKRAMQSLLQHSHAFFSNQKVGSLAGDVNTFSRSYTGLLDNLFLQLSSILVNFVTSLIIIAFIAPILLIPLGTLTVFIIIHSIRSIDQRAEYRNRRKKLMSQIFGTIADILGNQTLVRMFGRENDEVKKVVQERQEIEKIANKEIYILQGNAEIRQGVLFMFQIITIALCVYLFTHNSLAIGPLIFAITYLGRVTGSMFNISSVIRSAEQSYLDAAKVTEILSQSIEIVDRPHASPLSIRNALIQFNNVRFQYHDNENLKVFQNLNLTINAGERVGLAGKSGGGKTTLTHLLLRYMDIDSGAIKIDDQDIRDITQASLRKAIAYVPQDPFLFHRSLRDNIAYGSPVATDKEILVAAKQAHAMEFIDKLPNGLDTIVGERGIKLSGGQRQRIAIARAVLKDAPILVLDEATSALDSESEKLIQSALKKLMKGRTSIVVAHRLSTIAKLDRIIVIDDGKIVEDGTHAELLKQNGSYAKLWSHQSGGFIED